MQKAYCDSNADPRGFFHGVNLAWVLRQGVLNFNQDHALQSRLPGFVITGSACCEAVHFFVIIRILTVGCKADLQSAGSKNQAIKVTRQYKTSLPSPIF